MRKGYLSIVTAATLATLIAGCAQPAATGSGAPSASPLPLPSTDPVLTNAGDGIIIGAGWFPLEHFKGQTFHWATNDAEVTACPDANDRTLALQLEPGPGINGSPRPTAQITITGNHGDAATARIKGSQFVKVRIGSAFPAETFAIHATTMNHASPNGDKRILNYRILGAALGSSIADCKRAIVRDGSPLALGANWYTYETYAGQSFRWVGNDAQLKLTAAQPKPWSLELTVAPGPSLGEPLKLIASDGHGHTAAAVPFGPPSVPMVLTFALPPEPAGTTITLSTPTKNLVVHSDPRKILNFRVFNAEVRP